MNWMYDVSLLEEKIVRLSKRPKTTGCFQWKTRHCPTFSSHIKILKRLCASQCLWEILQLCQVGPLSTDMQFLFGGGTANFPSVLTITNRPSIIEQCQDYAPHPTSLSTSNSSGDSTKNSSRENHHDQWLQTGFRNCCSGVYEVK